QRDQLLPVARDVLVLAENVDDFERDVLHQRIGRDHFLRPCRGSRSERGKRTRNHQQPQEHQRSLCPAAATAAGSTAGASRTRSAACRRAVPGSGSGASARGSAAGSSRNRDDASRGGLPSWTSARRRCRYASRWKTYLSSAASSRMRLASSRSVRRLTPRRNVRELRTSIGRAYCQSGSTVQSIHSPAKSRTLLGPKSGSTRYGPEPTPQRPNVCPKSSLCFSSPISLATSFMPPTPSTELNAKRTQSVQPSTNFPCSMLFTPMKTSSMLAKKLRTQVRTGSGVMVL